MLIKSSREVVEVPVVMGELEFMLDLSNAELTSDEKGNESLCVMISVRGVDSKGEPLEVGGEVTACVS